jgi:hypothetical protein
MDAVFPRPSTFLIDLGPLRINLHWMDGIFPSSITLNISVYSSIRVWLHDIEMIEAKAFRIFIRAYSLFKSERLRANIKLTLRKAMMKSVMAYARCSRHLPLKIAAHIKRGSPHNWKFSKVHTGPQWFANGYQFSVCIPLYDKIMQATSRSHTKSWERTCSRYRTRQS